MVGDMNRYLDDLGYLMMERNEKPAFCLESDYIGDKAIALEQVAVLGYDYVKSTMPKSAKDLFEQVSQQKEQMRKTFT